MTEARGNLTRINSLARARVTLPAVALLLLMAMLTFVLLRVSATQAQRRNPRRAATAPPAGTIDYSRFSHATEKHKGACVICHKVPTRNWQIVREFPDVADFPDHDACVACHRRQFFKGASPQICAVCHVKISPRDDKRFAFRNPKSPQQFTIEFPHDRHQDVIARQLPAVEPATGVRFVKASFAFLPRVPEETKTAYNNCTVCHAKREDLPQSPAAGWIDSFVPGAGTFKSVPTSHASCFNCHWKSQPPVSTDCGGCHKATPRHSPELMINRISMKFRHAREQHVAECTTCHINITKSTTLRGLTPDVPIKSCTECHNKEGLRLDVAGELEAIDKKHDFVCKYCHTSNVGSKDPPASHYLISGRPPTKRSELK